jgi:hypothetical protein
LERLLRDARLSPGRYDELTARYPQALHEALFSVHAAAQGSATWFDTKLSQQAMKAPKAKARRR